ncbi:MAG TPA: hypothetical protein VMT60_03865, partial [Candidatus Bathyarchaeia archaeon]|nr:hypothetical protein [Candidatus Bathyarchaeia archaeon]
AKREALPPVPLGVNLLKNPSFEEWDGATPVGWTLQYFEGSGNQMNDYGKSSDEKSSGNFAFYLKGSFNVDRWMVLAQRQRVNPGCRLWFAAQMKGKNLQKSRGQTERANVYLRFYDADGKRIEDRYYAESYTPYLLGTTQWRKAGRNVDVPKNAVYAEFGLICELTGWIYFDDAELVLSEPPPWREIKGKYVNYYYLEGNPLPPGAVDKENEFVEGCVKKLHIKVEHEISYYYYPSEKKLQEMFGVTKGHELMIYTKGEYHTSRPYSDHEMVHMLLAPYGMPPFGLAEGSVFYVLGSWQDGRDLHMMAKELLINKQIPPLYKILSRDEMDRLGFSITVPAWASFSMWLIDRGGVDKFVDLYKATAGPIEAPGVFSDDFKKIYGKELDVMDRDWRLWVLRYQPKRK